MNHRVLFAAAYLCTALTVFGFAYQVLPEPWDSGVAFAAAAEFGRVAERLLPLHKWVKQ